MGIELLGPLRVGGQVVGLQRRDQVVLSALAVRAGDVMSADQLAEASWGESPPSSWQKQIHGSVLRLRRTLGSSLIETTRAGYRLTVSDDELDTRRFEELIARGRGLAVEGEFDRAAVAYGRALELWRGSPFEVLDGWSPGRIEAARLEELRLSAEESLLDARLASGEHRDVAAIAEAGVAEQPLREHRWAILATALYRCGRQADALRALKQARRTLVEQLGIEPGAELVALEQAILAQDESLLAVPAPPTISEHCPYKGLVPYDVDDAEMFFGRDGEVAACVERLRTSPLLVVTGPSGCGKSSLVRAGLVAALQRAGHAVLVFVPGGDPEAAMTNALASSTTDGPVLVVDQFEELFILDDDSSERARSLCARLAGYATETAPVVVTVRADHVAALAVDEVFAGLAERGLHLVKPLSGESLRQAIQGPAEAAGLRLEPGLIDLLVRDCEGEPGALPLLSHALAETWQRRDGRVLTVEGYRATGEIRGAVARSADRLYESLPAEQRPKLRSLMLRLVAPSPEGEPVRSRVPTRALGGDAERDRMLGLLVRARLVTTEENSVELAHEALARAWPRLRSWLDEDAAGQRNLRHLSTAADGWEALGRPTTELYRGARLEAALEWRAANSPDLTDQEAAFLDASIAAAAAEREQLAERARQQARQNRRLRRALTGVAILLVATLAGGVVAYQQRQSAERQRHTAESEERESALTALTGNAAALRSNRRDLAALLAIEAHRLAPSAATESALFGTFTASPNVTRTVRTDVELVSVAAETAFVPGTESLAILDQRAGLHIVDLETGRSRLLGALAETDAWSGLAVSSDGRYVAGFWRTKYPFGVTRLAVWDLSTGQWRFEPVVVPFTAGTVAINADGTLVAVGGGWFGRTAIYDGATGDSVVEPEPMPRPADAELFVSTVALAFDRDGRLIVGSQAGPVRIVDPVTGAEIRRLDAPPFTSDSEVFVSEDGTTLITVGSGTIVAGGTGSFSPVMGFDLTSGATLWREPHEVALRNCNSLAYAERLGALLCGEWSGRVVAYDLASGAEVGRTFNSQAGEVCGVAVSADGRRLVEVSACSSGSGPATIVEWSLDGGGAASRVIIDSRLERLVQRYGFAGDPNQLFIEAATETDQQPTSQVIDPSTGEVVAHLPDVYGLIETDDPDIVIAVFDEDQTIGLYDVTADAPAGPRVALDFDPSIWSDGHRVVATGWSAAGFQVQGIDLTDGTLVGPTIEPTTEFQFTDVIVSTDVMYIVNFVNARDEFRVERRDLETGDILNESAVGMASLARRRGVLVAGTTSGQIFELDPVTLEPLGQPFPGVTGPIAQIALDATGRRMLVRAGDMTLRLYDVPTRTQLGDAIDLDDPFPSSGSALRSDGLEAAAVVGQGIAVFDLDPTHWETAACRLAGRNLTHAEWAQYIGDLAPYRQTCPEFAADATT